MDNRPIGILDSGVGGLTVWQEIVQELPHEETLYIGDSLNAPYGDKNPDEIYHLARRLIQFLLTKNAKIIVVACNVITTTSLIRIRNEFKHIAIVGTVPVIKTAAEKTKNKKIGILSTNGTAKSHYQKHLIEQFAQGMSVVNIGTNLLVPLIEKGELSGPKVEKILTNVLFPFRKEKTDVIALGCTHFPILRNSIQKILGKQALLLDSGPAVARQVRRVLEHNNALGNCEKAQHQLFTTGNKDIFRLIVGKTGIKAGRYTITV